MTDLVERLRSKSPYLYGSSAERAMLEAADEIERLTKENEELLALLRKCRPYIANTSKALAGLIETALEPKP